MITLFYSTYVITGVIELVSDFVVCKEGEPLSPESARILVITNSFPFSKFTHVVKTILFTSQVWFFLIPTAFAWDENGELSPTPVV